MPPSIDLDLDSRYNDDSNFLHKIDKELNSFWNKENQLNILFFPNPFFFNLLNA